MLSYLQWVPLPAPVADNTVNYNQTPVITGTNQLTLQNVAATSIRYKLSYKYGNITDRLHDALHAVPTDLSTPMTELNDRWLSCGDISHSLGVCKSTVCKWINKHDMPENPTTERP